MDLTHQRIQTSLVALRDWIEHSNWKAYDPFDGLSSPFAKVLTLGHPFLRRVWQQSVRRSPFNLRPWLLIRPSMSSKAMGFFAQGFLRLHTLGGAGDDLERAKFCLKWLTEHRSPGFQGHCWGNHFDYEARGGRIPLGTPSIVWTSLIGHAFLDAYDALHDTQYLEVARGVGHFVLNELGWVETKHGDLFLRYTPTAAGQGVHNANMLGAGFLSRLNAHSPHPRLPEIADAAVRFTARAQLPNGAWYYGVEPTFHWVDSFHTGYVLESLHHFLTNGGDVRFREPLEKGYAFFIKTFFDDDGAPRYYDRKARPWDIQCASQGIQTLVNLRALHPQSLDVAIRVAHWTIANMQDRAGYFYFRKYPMITNKTPTLHWGQATMFASLSLLSQHLH